MRSHKKNSLAAAKRKAKGKVAKRVIAKPPVRKLASRKPGSTTSAQSEESLRRAVAAHAGTRKRLKEARDQIRVKNTECEEIRTRFEIALRGAQIHVFSQDRDLRYTWVYSPRGEESVSRMVGHTDDELWPSPEQQAVVSVKRKVLQTGKPEDCEVSYITPERRALFALHIDPVFAADRTVQGIMCTAVDISRIRSLESEQRRLAEELGTAAQRYESALRGSNITVFTQDPDLRYTSVSKPLFGRESTEIHGKRDDELLPAQSAAAIVTLKHEVLEKGVPQNAELRVDDGSHALWYDFHIEPMRDISGSLVGLTGAAVDITERKESEAHLRLLLRELTHRSKNLLAVIQAMARQTAKHTGNVETFLERFSARLQALARSHDLLVAESWHGASLHDLIRSQLGYYIDRDAGQVSIEGPEIQLKPEAAQSLGLALHELATNAAKHGALSKAGGRVQIKWQPSSNGGVELFWRETSGPKVATPTKRGFGSMVIEHNLARALDADVALDFAAEGLTCRMAVPQTQITAKP